LKPAYPRGIVDVKPAGHLNVARGLRESTMFALIGYVGSGAAYGESLYEKLKKTRYPGRVRGTTVGPDVA
jgi:hypothetical protein